MEREIDESVVMPVIKDYSQIDRISKTAVTAVVANLPIYSVYLFEYAFSVELQPNWQSVMSTFGPILGHYVVTSGLYLGLRSRLNSQLGTVGEEFSSGA